MKHRVRLLSPIALGLIAFALIVGGGTSATGAPVTATHALATASTSDGIGWD